MICKFDKKGTKPQSKENDARNTKVGNAVSVPTNNRIKSANVHITGRCNYTCKFCIAKNLVKEHRPVEFWIPYLELLRDEGIEKINLAGGEPFLYPHIEEFCKTCKEMGFLVSIISNGSLVNEETLSPLVEYLDWIGFSVDSTDEEVERNVGRCSGDRPHIEQVIKAARLSKDYGINVKLNITVIDQSKNCDFTELIEITDPYRVKIFQALEIKNMNDDTIDGFKVTDEEFKEFRSRHEHIVLSNGAKPVFEVNRVMIDSYLALDPRGLLMYDEGFERRYLELSPESIRLVNVEHYNERDGRFFETGPDNIRFRTPKSGSSCRI